MGLRHFELMLSHSQGTLSPATVAQTRGCICLKVYFVGSKAQSQDGFCLVFPFYFSLLIIIIIIIMLCSSPYRTVTFKFLAGLFTTAKKWKQPMHLSMDEWLSKTDMWYIHITEHHSVFKKEGKSDTDHNMNEP